jgi:hypothetical protein
VTTLRALPHSRRAHVDDTLSRVVTVVHYSLIAFVGLVLSAHGLVWRFMTSEPPAGRHEAMSHEAMSRVG